MDATRIDYIEFGSTDISKSRAFFAQAFGWGFADYGPGYAGLEGAGLDGGIEAVEPDAAFAPLVILYSADLNAAEAAVRAAGGEIVKEQFDFPGGRRFHFREPGGNVLAVWSDPGGKAG
ncbi:VOC family protein [Pelagibacterium montanilacus]|uniref:VOC family protein n=1 Tax=Pelagibacterium montanilacus TaxID=2185280 RepID=UPI000F8C5AC5|nr:VOC family protein [Pelagibacterium montanilacus]